MTPVHLPPDLTAALEGETAAIPLRDLEASVDRLIARYRTPTRADRPILVSATDAAAYAAYRMPATWGAVSAVLGALGDRVPGFAPRTLLDLGGGTGAAAWAAAGVFPSLFGVTVLDQVPEALDLGRRLARDSFSGALRNAKWQRWHTGDPAELPEADLVTVSYVLSELAPEDQTALVERAAKNAGAIAVLEPGTPDGYVRILAVRQALIDAGMHIAAPCPHAGACALAETRDWCHFASRINRTPLHRRLKSGDLGHEDEKFAYVVATRDPLPDTTVPGRILRHPQKRKGLVMLQVCTPEDAVQQALVSKRHAESYRAARDAEWGDPWPPSELA
jgi:ribosomal protein RSM22 (predicted rRNA methylase)